MAWGLEQLTKEPVRTCSFATFAVIAAVLFTSRTKHRDHPVSAVGSLQERDHGVGATMSNHEVESLVQTRTRMKRVSTPAMRRTGGLKQACSKLTNRGSHSTVEIEVGTPGQKFDVVADTGSNDLWVASCACKAIGNCFGQGKCFTGTNKSSTFLLYDGPGGAPAVRVTYGSGPVDLLIATDMVNIGGVKAVMNNSLFLAIDHDLKIVSQMEGILGLGIPANETILIPKQPPSSESSPDSVKPWGQPPISRQALDPETIRKIVEQIVQGILGNTPGSGAGKNSWNFAGQVAQGDARMLMDWNRSLGAAEKGDHKKNATNEVLKPKSFLEAAGIDTFQICFNDGGQDGALRFGAPMPAVQLQSTGQYHWGLDFHGVSVGKATAPVFFCNSKQAGQDSPCAGIPDSGTTMITAPSFSHFAELLMSICSNWDRCKMAVAKRVAQRGLTSDKYVYANVLLNLMMNCGSWLSNEIGLTEMPSLYFHVAGKNQKNQTLELTPWAYVMETDIIDQESIARYLSYLPRSSKDLHETLLELKENEVPYGRVCTLAFDTMEFETEKNGPVWIFGTSFFYQFVVDYNTTDKTMSFTSVEDKWCSPCSSSLSQQDASAMQRDIQSARQRPRRVNAPPRRSSIDTRLPL